MSKFGELFNVTTFGESHCYGVGCIVTGVPPRMKLTNQDIQKQLDRRRPGQSKITTQRNEKDQVIIMSGTEFGYTLGMWKKYYRIYITLVLIHMLCRNVCTHSTDSTNIRD